MKPRLAISVSGGRSSVVTMRRCLELYSETHDILSTFVNTGCEDEETLRFMRDADKHFANNSVVWIEAVINGPGVGVGFKVVDYATADRHGGPMRAATAKHGVFGPTHPQCTSRLKEEPMLAFRRAYGWEDGSYDTAIGIRADEADRMSPKRKEKRFVYPLVTENWRKRDVNEFMAQFDWDLKLPSDAWGNCKHCFKKSLRKLMTVAKAEPQAFDLPGELERKYGMLNKGDGEQPEPRVHYRGRLSAQDIVKMAFTEDFEPHTDKYEPQLSLFHQLPALDIGSGCGDSCEAGHD